MTVGVHRVHPNGLYRSNFNPSPCSIASELGIVIEALQHLGEESATARAAAAELARPPEMVYDVNVFLRRIPMGLLGELASLKHRISVRSYHRMGEAGVFAPDARVELIEGEIVDIIERGSRDLHNASPLSSRQATGAGSFVAFELTRRGPRTLTLAA